MTDADPDTPTGPCGLPKLLKVSAVAASLGVSESTVYNLVAAGELELIKLGPSRSSSSRIPTESLDAYIASRRAPSGATADPNGLTGSTEVDR